MRTSRVAVTEEELDRRLSAADRSRSVLSEEQSRTLVEAGVVRGSEPQGTRRRPFAWLVAGVTGVTILAGAVAAPSVAETLQYITQNVPENSDPRFGATPIPAQTSSAGPSQPAVDVGTETVPGSEWVNPAASDYVAWALSVYDLELPEPPGIDLETVATNHAQGWHDTILRDYGPGGIVVQASAQEGAWEQVVQCLWIDEWLSADEESKLQRRAVAQEALKDSLTWPGLRFGDDPDDPGMAEYWTITASAFAAGDRAGIEQVRQSNQCWTILRDVKQ